MLTATKTVTATAKAPSAEGTFEGEIDYNPPEGDKDGERISSFTNVPGSVVLGYQHAYGDPGAEIGKATVMPKPNGRHLLVLGRLDLDNTMGAAVHERMLLPSDDPMALKELSVGFDYQESKVTTDPNGVRVIHDAILREVSVVYEGSQKTSITSVKNARDREIAEINRKLDAILAGNGRKSNDAVDLDTWLAEDHAQRARQAAEAAHRQQVIDDINARGRAMAAAAAADPERPLALYDLNETPEAKADRERFEAELQERDAQKERERLQRERYDATYRAAGLEQARAQGAQW